MKISFFLNLINLKWLLRQSPVLSVNIVFIKVADKNILPKEKKIAGFPAKSVGFGASLVFAFYVY